MSEQRYFVEVDVMREGQVSFLFEKHWSKRELVKKPSEAFVYNDREEAQTIAEDISVHIGKDLPQGNILAVYVVPETLIKKMLQEAAELKEVADSEFYSDSHITELSEKFKIKFGCSWTQCLANL